MAHFENPYGTEVYRLGGNKGTISVYEKDGRYDIRRGDYLISGGYRNLEEALDSVKY